MTREEIINTPELVDFMLDESVIADSREKLRKRLEEVCNLAIKALEQEPKTGWNNHQIACMLADLFGDACACNYNGIDEWLGELCDFKDTCCPNPVGVACWEQFLKYSQSRYTECGYEARDKNALQDPKTGHWIKKEYWKPLPYDTEPFDYDNYDEKTHSEKVYHYCCSECGLDKGEIKPIDKYCNECGTKMQEVEE